MKLSVIVPLYYGNKFIPGLVGIVKSLSIELGLKNDELELILVNDSPSIPLEIPYKANQICVKKITNINNCGIQTSRVKGLIKARGEFVIFLDQDDELIVKNYKRQFEMINSDDNVDVVVGNAIYDSINDGHPLYKNEKEMQYLIREKMFINIRDLISSPGQCIIRKKAIPLEWENNILTKNGADDWMLWLLLFNKKAKFICNEKTIYHHRSTDVGNLSSNYEKMYLSCKNMINVLNKNSYPYYKLERLKKAIKFKYLKDTGRLNLRDLFRYSNCIFNNIVYKVNTKL